MQSWKHAWEQPYLARTTGHIFRNTFQDIERIVTLMGREHGSRFEFECYDVGHLYNLAHMLDQKVAEPPLFVQTIFGILGGIGAETRNLQFMRDTADRLFGDKYVRRGRSCTSKAATGWGSRPASIVGTSPWFVASPPHPERECPMLALLAGNGLCPCCAFAMSPPSRRSARFACTDPAVTFSGIGPAGGADPAPTGTLCIDGGTVVDPRDGSLTENASVVVENGRIVSLDGGGPAKVGPSARRVDARGKFVVPGYNDMHSHVLELADPSGALALMLAEGVTGFRQMSGSPQRLEERRNGTLPVGKDAPAALEMPGTVLTPLNAGSSEDAAAEIRRQQEQGADFIKVGFVSPPVFTAALEEARRAGIAILGHLQDGVDAAAAAQAGFRSVEHLGPGTTVWIGCSTAEDELRSEAKPVRIKAPPLNVPFLRRIILWRLQTMLINPLAFASPRYAPILQRAVDTFSENKFRDLAARFVAEGTWHVPTLVRLRTQELADAPEYQDDLYLQYMPEGRIRKWRRVTARFRKLPSATRRTYAEAYPRQLQLTKLLSDSGVRMMTGTDGGWLSGPGLTLKEEFAELAKAGLSSLRILRMATINAAEYLGRTETMGTVEPGRDADMVLLDANPLESVANLHAIGGVVRAGSYYSGQDLDTLRARVASNRGYLN